MCLFSTPFLLLLLCGAQASHFYGTVITFDSEDPNPDGSVSVVLRYKTGFHACSSAGTWVCSSGSSCGSQTALEVNTVQSATEWCQREGIMSRLLNSNAPFQMELDGGNWISNIVNNIGSWRAVTLVDLRTRSDTGKANRSPQTTIIPSLRIPSNCARNFNLLAFDPDGDRVECRVGTGNECNPCTPPSVLNISTSCTLSYAAPSGVTEGAYAVQLYMEDFPNQSLTLTQTGGSQTSRTTSNALSKIPLQFVVKVDGAVASCTQGQYLPRFLSPTPANRAKLYTPVGQTLEITINTTATLSTVSNLWFSGPHNMNLTGSGQGPFTLRWTPSQSEDGEHHPVCFVAQATLSTAKYDSELRCVIVSVSNDPGFREVIGLRMGLSSETSLTEEDIENIVLPQIKEELVKLGLPSDIILKLTNVKDKE